MRVTLTLLAVLGIATALIDARGIYSLRAILLLGLAFACSLAAVFAPARLAVWREADSLAVVLPLSALALSGRAALENPLAYADVTWLAPLINAMSVTGFVVVLALAGARLAVGLRRFRPAAGGEDRDQPPAAPPGWWFWLLAGVLFTTGLAVRGGAVAASTDPLIDVYAWLRAAPAFLLEGKNPYAMDYPSPYGTPRAAAYEIDDEPEPRPAAYPPQPILLSLPFSFLEADVRWANVVADLIASWVLFETARRRGDVWTAAFAAGAYLHFPHAAFMIEQAWYEPMLAALLGTGLLLVERGRLSGYGLLALGLTAKQYGVCLLPCLLAGCRGNRVKLLACVAAVVGTVFGPFLLWGPEDFLSIVVGRHLGRPVQYGSLTFGTALLHLFRVETPRAVLWSLAAAVIGVVAWRTRQAGPQLGVSLGASLLTFCLCHTQGFFNYYYLCTYFLLLGVAGQAGRLPLTPGGCRGLSATQAHGETAPLGPAEPAGERKHFPEPGP